MGYPGGGRFTKLVFSRGRFNRYLVLGLWLIMGESGVNFVLRVFVGLKRIIEESV